MRRCLQACVWVLLVPGAGWAVDPPVEEVVARADRLYRSETSRANVEMTVVTPNWTRTMAMEIWTEEMDKTFVTLNSPRKDAGISTLRIENEMWNYFPRINKIIKVPPSMMMGSWMGSDFTNDDLVKESSLLADYEARYGDAPDTTSYLVVLIPREETPSVWGRIELTLGRADLLPSRYVYYDEDGEAIREMILEEVRSFDGRQMPALLRVVPFNKEGHSTQVRYLDAEFDIELASGVFSLRHLRRSR